MKTSSAFRKNVPVLATVIALLCAPAMSQAALVAAWGASPGGQSVPSTAVNVKAIAGGYSHSLALRADGRVVAWGDDYAGRATVPADLTNVTAISAGLGHNLAVKADGTVVAWGGNSGDETNVPAGLANVTAVAAGFAHSLALKADGTVVAWGSGSIPSQTNIPAGLANVVAIAAGWYHDLALKADGTVVAWGGDFASLTNVPPDLTNVTAVAAGSLHSLALKRDGTLVAWGSYYYPPYNGPVWVPLGLSNVIAIAAGADHSLALQRDGTIVAWGSNSDGQTNVPLVLTNATAIAAGGHHSLALVFDGPVQILQNPQSQGVPYTSNVTFSVVAAGREPIGYRWLFNGVSISPNARVSGTTNATLTITNLQFSDIGTYAVVVSNAFGSVISSGATLVVISPPFITQQPTDRTVRAGSEATIAASASGTPPLSYQWNFNGTNIPSATNATLFLPNAQPVASGAYYLSVTNSYGFAHTITISLIVTDSAPYILQQPYVRLADQSTTTNPVVPIDGSVAINASARGSLPLSYQWRFSGVDIPNATNTTLLLSNLRYDQTGYYNLEIGNAFGTTNSAKVFLNVSQVLIAGTPFIGNTNMPPALSNVIAVAAGGSHVLVLKSDGTVRTWLANANYIFDQAYAVTNVPGSVTNVIAIAAGRSHCLALRSNGTVVAWGPSTSAQTNVPTGLSNVLAIAAGWNRSYAVKSDGTVVGWGSDPAVPAGLSNVVSVAAGPSQNLALKREGTITAWGKGSLAIVPSGLSNIIAIAAGSTYNLALRQNGTIVVWPNSGSAPPPAVAAGSNAIAISVGSGVGMALIQNGTLVSSGFERLAFAVTNNLVAIAAGEVQAGFGVTLLGNGGPAITLQPGSQTGQKGATVQLHARAAGILPMSYQWQLENQNLPGATNASLLITNAQGKDTGGYRMIVSNPLGTATSRTAVLAIPYNTNLAAALNTNNWQWSNERTTNWFAQIRENHDGDVAAQSGAIPNNQTSVLATSITGPGTLTFWWKVSSEEGFDFLKFFLDNSTTPLAIISGENDWEQRTIRIGIGTHALRWIYSKDVSVSAGRDAGWLDEVVFTPDPPVITQQPTPSRTLPAGSSTTYSLTVNGVGPFSYQWLKDGVNLPGATKTSLVLTNLTRRDSAIYRARVSNAGGSVTSSNAMLKVIVQQRLDSIHLAADGSTEFLSRDADGGLLLPQDLSAFEAQASTNLVTWETLPNVLGLTNGSLVLHDPGSTNFPVRFYRMVEH